jgi:hypothetical protein
MNQKFWQTDGLAKIRKSGYMLTNGPTEPRSRGWQRRRERMTI